MPESLKKPLAQLTERNYVGVGYHHIFVNDETKEDVYVSCTEEEYTKMSGENGAQFNPTLNGFACATEV
jgi:hypothetical protein